MNCLFNLINRQPAFDKIYSYAKDPSETKYHFLINKRESIGLRHFHDSRVFIKYSNDMDDIHKNIEQCNPKQNP